MLDSGTNGHVCRSKTVDTICVPMNPVLGELQFRFLEPSDVEEVKELSRDCFPINYPDSWFVEITSSPKLCSLAAVHSSRIIGMIVVEVKPFTSCNHEDSDLLSCSTCKDAQVAYILSLGVAKQHRRSGIGSVLLQQGLDHLQSSGRLKSDCKAIYLHCMVSNLTALKFYKRRGFREHSYLANYYGASAQSADAYCCVKYINGGEPPWSLSTLVVVVNKICAALKGFMSSVPCWSNRLLQFVRRHVWSSANSLPTRRL